MNRQSILLAGLTGLGLAIAPPAVAQMEMEMEMPAAGEQTAQFQRIEQPWGVKVAVTAGGLVLIGAELWWFLRSKPKSRQVESHDGVQEITIAVDGGYDPSQVVVQAGQPVRLNFLRRDPSSCLEKVLIPDFHIARDLDLDQVTPIEFTPDQPGHYEFTCGMNMFRGEIEVQPAGQTA